MKGFLKDMNLARGIILASILGSIVLGVMGFQRARQVSELSTHLEEDVTNLVKQLQTLARRHSELSRKARQEELGGGQADLESYIRKMATKDNVEIGDLRLTPSTDQRTKGVEDKKYRIRAADRERKFPRTRLANFLYSLESGSQRVKITDIQLEVAEKKIKPYEIPEDFWVFEAEVTSRQRIETTP